MFTFSAGLVLICLVLLMFPTTRWLGVWGLTQLFILRPRYVLVSLCWIGVIFLLIRFFTRK